MDSVNQGENCNKNCRQFLRKNAYKSDGPKNRFLVFFELSLMCRRKTSFSDFEKFFCKKMSTHNFLCVDIFYF